jgi:hypothetical protein
MFSLVCERFIGITEREIADAIRDCKFCKILLMIHNHEIYCTQRAEPIKKHEVVQPIASTLPNERLVIDLVDFKHLKDFNDSYTKVLNMVDHFRFWYQITSSNPIVGWHGQFH